MSELRRITTFFVPAEDRIRLAGELAEGDIQVLWLTRRLTERLVPVLVGWLEECTPVRDAWQGTVMQSFAQQMASTTLAPQAPVAGEAASSRWLVSAVDIRRGEQQLALRFKGTAGEQANLSLAPWPLRQWLCILYMAYRQADWPVTVWPQWLCEAIGSNVAQTAEVMH